MASNDFPLESGWRLVLHELGVHPADVLRRAELPEDLLSRGDVRVSTHQYFRFWESLRAEIDDPLFPIRLVEAATAETFMPALFAALCSPNLLIGMQRLSKYKRLIAPMHLHVDETPEAVQVSFEWLDATVEPPASLSAMELAFIVHLARMGTRHRIRPLSARAPRPPSPMGAYKRFLGARIEVGPRLSLTFSRQDAERPFLTAKESVWKAFEPELRTRLGDLQLSASVGERVQAALLESLPSGQASADRVARKLAMSKRTLQRRLREEGTTFNALLNGTRLQLARHYLSNTVISCAEISFLLGYEDPNSFFRAFHEWTGRTPESARRAANDGTRPT